MKTKKLIKALVAAAMLACVTAAFFGYDTDLACRIQPAATIWFLIVLLLTPIVGRLFCECFCPLGIIQSIVNWIFHPKSTGSSIRRRKCAASARGSPSRTRSRQSVGPCSPFRSCLPRLASAQSAGY